MELKVIIDEELYTLNVPEAFLTHADTFFTQMDLDMDKGIQMSRQWIPSPNLDDRLRMVGNKLLTALETENHDLGRMMAGYILSRAPDIDNIELDTSGEIQNTVITYRGGSSKTDTMSFGLPPQFAMADSLTDPYGMDPALRQRAEKKVSAVFKQGRVYAYSLYDDAKAVWETVTVGKDEAEAQRLRDAAILQKMRELAH